MNKRNLSLPLAFQVMLLLLFGMNTICTSAQNKNIVTGIVVDQKGLSMPGVNVTVKGNKGGTITDFDGNALEN